MSAAVGHDPYEGMHAYVGDIHNHCGISYGHGSIEDAYANAALQLDFASVTGHASWHDMPVGDPRLAEEETYHREGFERLAGCWPHVQEITDAANRPGEFVSLLSFEWHSMTYGDHCVYYRGSSGPILRAGSLEELRSQLRALAADGLLGLAIPHHIGYRKGWRGINWDAYTEEFSPVAEIMSMHGCGESDRAPRNYLHTMGPRDAESMAYSGLERGHVFGFIGSTDHHSAHPGSHGYGRMVAMAPDLTRESVWHAIEQRRTYAITGDRIDLRSAVNGYPMGAIAPPARQRRIDVRVVGGGELAEVEVVRNGTVIHTERPAPAPEGGDFSGVLGLAVGWGKAGLSTDWDVELAITGGSIESVEPRLRGVDIVDPLSAPPSEYAFSRWERVAANRVRLRTRTHANPTVLTDATQQLALRIRGDDSTLVTATINGSTVSHRVGELRRGPRSGYTGGFVSPAFQFLAAISDLRRSLRFEMTEERDADRRDWYHVRVRQTNDQWAFGSPTWVCAAR
ncbi:MAG: hypothetical protein QM655_15725 [Nocardioidaceae bacterium]